MGDFNGAFDGSDNFTDSEDEEKPQERSAPCRVPGLASRRRDLRVRLLRLLAYAGELHGQASTLVRSPPTPLVISCDTVQLELVVDVLMFRYGKVFRSHLFGSPTIVSTDAEVSRWVLQSDGRSFVPSYPKSLTELMGKSSILLINGNLQRRVHGLIGAFFKSSDLKAQITRDMQRYVRQSMGSWKNEQLIHIQDEAKHVSPRSPLPSPH